MKTKMRKQSNAFAASAVVAKFFVCSLALMSIGFSGKCQNTSYGQNALPGNTGSNNTALGKDVLGVNSNGSHNSGTGFKSLFKNTTGNSNTASGYYSLGTNTSGTGNTANGYMALYTNTTANENSANGVNALFNNTIGFSNSAFGVSALRQNTNGDYNTAMGVSALRNSTTGNSNTAFGYQALYENVSGSGNTAIGYKADVGSEALTNATAIGANAKVTESNSIQLGDNVVEEIYGGTGTNAVLITGALQITGWDPEPGDVLVSDDNGNARWETQSVWTASGPNIRYTAGSVSIGTNLKPIGYKLAVGGKMLGEALDVKFKSAWPDFVFEDDYNLLPLTLLEKQIHDNGHLPEVPSAQEVKSDGLSVGEMSANLLKKIEELTLYTIDLQKKILAQQRELKSLKKE